MTLQRILAIALLPSFVGSCVLQGYDSGVCQEWTLAGFKGQIDFCSEHVTYRACMPQKPVRRWSDLLHSRVNERFRSLLCAARSARSYPPPPPPHPPPPPPPPPTHHPYPPPHLSLSLSLPSPRLSSPHPLLLSRSRRTSCSTTT